MATMKVNLNEALKKYFGFDKFKGDQKAIIQNVLDGKDTFVLMPTGGGKSLCYQLPSLLMEGTAIVISPLIALMKNQVDVISAMSEEGTAHYLNSSLNKSAIDQVKEDVKAGRTKLLYVAPESLTKDENVEFLKQAKISFYAIDEAHCISEWGHDFRPEYRRIRPIINEIGNAPIIALTATATDKVRTDIKKNLAIVDAVEFKAHSIAPICTMRYVPKQRMLTRTSLSLSNSIQVRVVLSIVSLVRRLRNLLKYCEPTTLRLRPTMQDWIPVFVLRRRMTSSWKK